MPQANYAPGDRIDINDIDGQLNVNATGWGFLWEGTGPRGRNALNSNTVFDLNPANWLLVFTAIWLP